MYDKFAAKMSRNSGMSGANNIPLGQRSSGGSLSSQATGFSGVSLLNPSYLAGSSNGSDNHRRPSKFGPPVEGKVFYVMKIDYVSIR